MLPLSTVSIAMYINDTVKLPLQVVLRNILTAGMIEDTR